jgi:ribonuclease-3
VTNLRFLEENLGYTFKNKKLLEQALTHSSLSSTQENNERLEFLGDRVLGLVIAHLLFQRFSEAQEGSLSLRHTQLVNKETLSQIGLNLSLGQYLRMARGERASGGQLKKSLLADACEALIAALYLDGGLSAAQDFIVKYWEVLLNENSQFIKDAKSKLQEQVQAQGKNAPRYEIIERVGPDHAPLFTVAIFVEGVPSMEGSGASRREAEQQAAHRLLDYLEKNG